MDFGEIVGRSLDSKVALSQKPVILIDNGSYECRAGWNTEALPQVVFRNQVAKPKTLANREIDQCHIVGDEFGMFDPSKI